MRPSLPWITALIGSVLINGALVGYLVHHTTDGPDWQMRVPAPDSGPGRGGAPGRGGFDLRGFVEALPEASRQEARVRLRASFADMGDLARDGRLARRQLDTLLVADEFDTEAVAQAMAELRQIQREVEARIEAVVLDVVSELDAETRAAALQAGRDRMGRRGPPPGGHRRHGPRDGQRDGQRDGPRDGPPPTRD
ncbi:periplasmic heavy metal sensor [Maricaulis sp.]|uniref:periplasmic heavy metal sensor n=1 Tax=Maricaulis sp. TaxID=1486257 RepID=UPI0025EE88F8|nr:periplasmic heavy metal sensor [Maricaulis sp.]MDF1768816.1 periplasmic heavy metal sensor [Maricaulis sp.]